MSSLLNKSTVRAQGKTRYPKEAYLRANLSQQIALLIEQSNEFQRAERVALFAALPWEVELSGLLRPGNKTFAYPKVTPGKIALTFYKVSSLSELTPGYAGILEPPPSAKAIESWQENDLILIPGLGFDAWGARVGSGAGYYDRFLEGKNVLKWGVCFETQWISEKIEQNTTDITMNAVVTEKGLHRLS